MVLSIENPGYHVDTFLSMQESLGNYLNQSFDNEGIWSVAEKKRQLNLGCINIVGAVSAPKTFIEKEIKGTVELPADSFEIPSNMLKPYRLWVGGLQHQQVSDDSWFLSKTTLDTVGSAHGARVFWWDTDQNKIWVSPGITDLKKLTFRYVRMPRLLANDDDVPDLHPLLWHVPPMWAAWRMLYRDEEHGDRGRSARTDYKDAIKEFNAFRFKEIGNKQQKIILDPLVFPTKRTNFGSLDLGETFDRLD